VTSSSVLAFVSFTNTGGLPVYLDRKLGFTKLGPVPTARSDLL
jgi:hypothetical protein